MTLKTAMFLGVVALLILLLIFHLGPSYAAKSVEHRLVYLDMATTAQWQKALNEAGKDGWELVAVHLAPGSPHLVAFMKK